jgi:hypothetical protein
MAFYLSVYAHHAHGSHELACFDFLGLE